MRATEEKSAIGIGTGIAFAIAIGIEEPPQTESRDPDLETRYAVPLGGT